MLGAIALALGVGRAGYGIYSAHQRKQKNKGIIGQQYRQGLERQQTHQGDVAASHLERLNARGLLSGSAGTMATKPVEETTALHPDLAGTSSGPLWKKGAAGLTKTTIKAAVNPAPRTLGEAERAELGEEFAMERRDLDTARDNALQANSDAATQAMIDSVGQGVQSGMSVYSMGQDLAAMKSMPDPSVGQPTTIRGAFGLPVDPWAPDFARPSGSMTSWGQFSNADFNVRS